jgi:hypothetical protein
VCTDEPTPERVNPIINPQAKISAPGTSGTSKGIIPKMSKVTNNEKTLLLSSDDEFQ